MSYDTTEQQRLRTNYERVEALMRDFRWHTSVEIMQVGGMRGVGRLHEAKAHGYDYDKRRRSPGVWEYRLKPKAITPEQLPLLELEA